MSRKDHILQEFTAGDFNKFRSLAERQEYSGGQLIFSEGDAADYIYFYRIGPDIHLRLEIHSAGGNRHTGARRILR